jgi:hypothetical protein
VGPTSVNGNRREMGTDKKEVYGPHPGCKFCKFTAAWKEVFAYIELLKLFINKYIFLISCLICNLLITSNIFFTNYKIIDKADISVSYSYSIRFVSVYLIRFCIDSNSN